MRVAPFVLLSILPCITANAWLPNGQQTPLCSNTPGDNGQRFFGYSVSLSEGLAEDDGYTYLVRNLQVSFRHKNN